MLTREVRASAGRNTQVLILGVVGAAFFGYATQIPGFSGIEYYGSLALAIFFGGAALLSAAGLVLGLPKIIADARGIALKGLVRRKFWTWESCGRFFLSTLQAPGRFGGRQYLICAFTRQKQEVIDAQEAHLRPDFMHCDIKIPLIGTEANRSQAEALALVDDLNLMREERMATRGSGGSAATAAGQTRMLEELERTGKRRLFAYGVILVLFILGTAGAIALRFLD